MDQHDMSDRSSSNVRATASGKLTPEARCDAVARAVALAPHLRNAAPQIEAARSLPPEVVDALHSARMFRLLLPRTIGGDELDLKTLAQTMEAIARADASTAWCVGQASGCAIASAFLKPDVNRRLFGPADAVLAWGAGIAGKMVACDGGYRITGKWMFASGSANATLLGGHCYVFEADGTQRKRADGRNLDRTALFIKSKAHIHDMWHTMGLKGTASHTYEVNDLFVPGEETIDREDIQGRTEQGTLYIFPTTQIHATAFSALMLGIAQGMVNELMTLAMTKTPRGASSSLKESPVFQQQIAVLEARLRSCRAYLHTTLDEIWARTAETRELPLADMANLKLASTFVINQGVEIATEAYRAAGAHAIFQSGPFEQRLRDCLSASQQVQGRPANFVTIGRVLLGLPPDTTLLGG
jgi:indole-3-acetate monooxygenase